MSSEKIMERAAFDLFIWFLAHILDILGAGGGHFGRIFNSNDVQIVFL